MTTAPHTFVFLLPTRITCENLAMKSTSAHKLALSSGTGASLMIKIIQLSKLVHCVRFVWIFASCAAQLEISKYDISLYNPPPHLSLLYTSLLWGTGGPLFYTNILSSLLLNYFP